MPITFFCLILKERICINCIIRLFDIEIAAYFSWTIVHEKNDSLFIFFFQYEPAGRESSYLMNTTKCSTTLSVLYQYLVICLFNF
jgi:hypothetical protein